MATRANGPASGASGLALGVKGKLSNQEMELLKQQLATATAYDHVPESKRAERRAKAAAGSTPMTRIYHKVDRAAEEPEQSHRPQRKTLASIQYEMRFTDGAYYDSLVMRPPPKGIPSAAKTVLQDEYVTRPRAISVVPRNLAAPDPGDSVHDDELRTGKRRGPAAIPQVFIL